MSGVTITTYTMIAFSGKRSEESARVMDQIRSREWGLLLMDEVHVVPAQMFRKVSPSLCPSCLGSWDMGTVCVYMLHNIMQSVGWAAYAILVLNNVTLEC